MGNEWLQSGNCPIAKSFRAVSSVLPLVANVLKPPPGMKFRCPPAVVAARAALSKTVFAKSLRPQSLPTKVLVIGMLGMAANVPLGVWREHTEKFSPSWFAAVHAAVPFIAMLRKSVLMPKSAMAFTIAASILGQVIGSRAERYRLKAVARKLAIMETCDVDSEQLPVVKTCDVGSEQLPVVKTCDVGSEQLPVVKTVLKAKDGHCRDSVDWNAVALGLAAPRSSTNVFC